MSPRSVSSPWIVEWVGNRRDRRSPEEETYLPNKKTNTTATATATTTNHNVPRFRQDWNQPEGLPSPSSSSKYGRRSKTTTILAPTNTNTTTCLLKIVPIVRKQQQQQQVWGPSHSMDSQDKDKDDSHSLASSLLQCDVSSTLMGGDDHDNVLNTTTKGGCLRLRHSPPPLLSPSNSNVTATNRSDGDLPDETTTSIRRHRARTRKEEDPASASAPQAEAPESPPPSLWERAEVYWNNTVVARSSTPLRLFTHRIQNGWRNSSSSSSSSNCGNGEDLLSALWWDRAATTCCGTTADGTTTTGAGTMDSSTCSSSSTNSLHRSHDHPPSPVDASTPHPLSADLAPFFSWCRPEHTAVVHQVVQDYYYAVRLDSKNDTQPKKQNPDHGGGNDEHNPDNPQQFHSYSYHPCGNEATTALPTTTTSPVPMRTRSAPPILAPTDVAAGWVTSRTHEDIEVSPGHCVQVRLPPTHPIVVVGVPPPSLTEQSPTTTAALPHHHHQPTTTSTTNSPTFNNSNNCNDAASRSSTKPALSQRQQRPATTMTAQKIEAERRTAATTSVNVAAAAGSTTTTTVVAPVRSFLVKPEEAAELERSISELTMRSSYAANTAETTLPKVPENRRMAYYAVGKHHRQSGRGGNRRCYFTGKLILGGAPFYAGSVLQGLRTLVVFCLPSAIGLPDKECLLLHHQHPSGNGAPFFSQQQPHRTDSHSTTTCGTVTTGASQSLRGLRLLKAGTGGSGSRATTTTSQSHFSSSQYTNQSSSSSPHNGGAASSPLSPHSTPPLLPSETRSNLSRYNKGRRLSLGGGASSTAGYSHASKSIMSRLSSLDDLSLSIEGDLDPNWSLERDFLLKVLPPAGPDLLLQMATLYPDQFETLPVQVRDAQQWKLYVKFCFFSGLPITDGEMHYKVRDEIAEQVYGEEIVLSHDVMEASVGASAEILTLPNRTVIRYLRKHYAQQCSKLDDRVFQRSSWERVAPEV